MNHRFTLYEQRMTRTRRHNRIIRGVMGAVATAICLGLLYVTRWP